MLDEPNARSSHSQPTPRGGGVVFVVLGSISSLMVLHDDQFLDISALLLFSALLGFVGFIDDHLSLPASWRYGAQIITAALILHLSPIVHGLTDFFEPANLFLFLILVVLLIAVTAVINFANFMDGLDGLVAGCMSIAIAALGFSLAAPWPLWALEGSLLGFLLWNWSPARVFMGDVGSTFLGSFFIGLVLQSSSWIEALSSLLVATPLLVDACLCVIRRVLSGQRIFQAHRLHLFQRLHQAGWTHARVSLTYIAATAILALAMLAAGLSWLLCLAFMELLVWVWLDQRVAVPFAVASQISGEYKAEPRS